MKTHRALRRSLGKNVTRFYKFSKKKKKKPQEDISTETYLIRDKIKSGSIAGAFPYSCFMIHFHEGMHGSECQHLPKNRVHPLWPKAKTSGRKTCDDHIIVTEQHARTDTRIVCACSVHLRWCSARFRLYPYILQMQDVILICH